MIHIVYFENSPHRLLEHYTMSKESDAVQRLIQVLENEGSEKAIQEGFNGVPSDSFSTMDETLSFDLYNAILEAVHDWNAPIPASELARIGIPVLTMPDVNEAFPIAEFATFINSNLYIASPIDYERLKRHAVSEAREHEAEGEEELSVDIGYTAFFAKPDGSLYQNSLFWDALWHLDETSYDETSHELRNLLIRADWSTPERPVFTDVWLTAILDEDGALQNVTVVKTEDSTLLHK